MKTLKDSILEAKSSGSPIKISLKEFEFVPPRGKSYHSVKAMMDDEVETFGDYFLTLNVTKSESLKPTGSNAKLTSASIDFNLDVMITIGDDMRSSSDDFQIDSYKINSAKEAYGLITKADALDIIDYCFNTIDTYPDIDGNAVIKDILTRINNAV